ncbi:MAG: tRNA lysidine(34) synthetase TilS [Balneolaceae bacterium]
MSKFESSPIVKEFRKQKANNLQKENIFVITGVSGGPDSMALLYLLHRFEIKTVAVHCNYQLRGENSEKDQELVEKMCGLWGIECVAVRLDVKEAGNQNFQAWARSRRYQVFNDLRNEYGADLVATAHHEDDQLETIFQKILRGAGMPAWKGMSVIDQDIFRPLLRVQKSDIMMFVEDNNIPYRIDSSNEESTYSRNFLRHNWFPLLNKLFPGWRENLLKIPIRAAEFEGMADEILSSLKKNRTTLRRENFLALSPGIREPLLHRFYETSGMNGPISTGAISEISRLDTLQTGKTIQLNNTTYLTRNRDYFVLEVKETKTEEPVTIHQDQLNKETRKDDFIFKIKPVQTSFEEGTLHLDADKICFPVKLRQWENGDRFSPLGMEGNQLVSDHLTNRKIRSTEKSRAKIIESFDGIICAVIFPHKLKDGQIGTLADPFRCTSETRQIFTIRKQ